MPVRRGALPRRARRPAVRALRLPLHRLPDPQRRGMARAVQRNLERMTLHADIFWSFRSPYSYLATRRYRALTEEYDLTLSLRPVYPLAIRQPDFFERSHPNWLRYTFLDVFRVAQFLEIPFGPPRPDPIVQDIATRRIAAEQPHIFRLTRLGQAAARRG